MRSLSSKFGSSGWGKVERPTIILFLSIFIIYVAVRGGAWANTVLLEDTDSLSYLKTIKDLLTFDLQRIIDLDPDSSLFYAFFGALFSLPGWSVETGARLCSLFFSSLLFIALLGIGKRMARPLEVALGLLILSLSPVLISFSFAVLTEPSYVATIYLGLWLFWTQYKKPSLWRGGLLGIVFGLAFSNRVEGILYCAVVPLLQGIYVLWEGRKDHSLGHFVRWSLVFVACFSLIAVPQMWRVSHKMGAFAINGRQVWSLVLNNPDGKSDNEKVFGLDFSPSQYNIEYIKDHPEVLDQFESKTGLIDYIKLVNKNLTDLYQDRLGVLIGPFVLMAFGFGLLALYRSGHRFEMFLIIAFIGFSLVGPLLHNVVMRHIVIIAPIIFLKAGVGVVYLSDSLLAGCERCFPGKHALPYVFLLGLIGASAYPLVRTDGTFRPPRYNVEYGLAELVEPVAIVREVAKKELLRTPIVLAQRGYISYLAGAEHRYVPYTDYDGLVRFCDLNDVDFLYLKHSRVREYPFLDAFLEGSTHTDFVLLHRGLDPSGEKIELYRSQENEGDSIGSDE